jgi:putative acetyltransferase
VAKDNEEARFLQKVLICQRLHHFAEEGLRMKITIRPEQQGDIEFITEVTRRAFENHPISHQTEHFIVIALRAAGALALSLVAEVDGAVIGHVAFSPVAISDGAEGWYGVGPVSVTPELQRKGIGKSLMNEGLSLLQKAGAKGCTLVGDPAYYERFGFRNLPSLVYDGIPQEYFLALKFIEGDSTSGTVTFHEGFGATS